MQIIEDTRQKIGMHEHKAAAFAAAGVQVTRCKLPWGDYALTPTLSIDTKESIYELAQNINNEHKRFKNEIVDARDHGCRLIILTENTDGIAGIEDLQLWAEDYEHYCMRLRKNPKAQMISGKTLAKACRTMSERYGVRFLFCAPEEAAEIITNILGGQTDGVR